MKRENWNSIAKKLTGEKLDHFDEAALDEMQADKDLRNVYDESEDTLKKVDLYFNLKNINTNAAWDQLEEQMPVKRVIPWRIRIMQTAAVALLLIAIGLGTWKLMETKNTLVAKTAENDLSHPEVILPDGSKVSLNYGSKLIYPKTFSGKQREVKLIGEAFFEVTPDAKHPFVIQTKNAAIRVLGTSFNVLAYDNNEKVEVYVKTGKVELMKGGSQMAMNDKVLLLPGEKGIYNSTTQSLIKEILKQTNELAWITRDIEFRNSTLSEVIQTLKHVYKLNISTDKSVDLNQTITVTFSHQDPDYIMEVVAITLDLHLNKLNQSTYRFKK